MVVIGICGHTCWGILDATSLQVMGLQSSLSIDEDIKSTFPESYPRRLRRKQKSLPDNITSRWIQTVDLMVITGFRLRQFLLLVFKVFLFGLNVKYCTCSKFLIPNCSGSKFQFIYIYSFLFIIFIIYIFSLMSLVFMSLTYQRCLIIFKYLLSLCDRI